MFQSYPIKELLQGLLVHQLNLVVFLFQLNLVVFLLLLHLVVFLLLPPPGELLLYCPCLQV